MTDCTDRDRRDRERDTERDREEREEEDRRQAETDRRDRELREAWRKHHPYKEKTQGNLVPTSWPRGLRLVKPEAPYSRSEGGSLP